ncbi:MAG: biopolymer transporter ExbD [Flavobacteriaceae bacterium]|nr:biopolymer transporter ExbD [Flavobacteriaceae bacterium]
MNVQHKNWLKVIIYKSRQHYSLIVMKAPKLAFKIGILFEVAMTHQNLQHMRTSRNVTTINAGSMADIAFLLLLFFLVSTTISQEKGLLRKLPDPCPKNQDCTADIHERNVLHIQINQEGRLLVNNEVTELKDLQINVIGFLDNNGNGTCTYCNGIGDGNASDHPQKAVISLSSHRLAPYSYFISVQDELSKAYKELRSRYAENTFRKNLDALSVEEIKATQQAYPFIVSEISVAD